VHQNDPITGYYVYDSETPDSEPQLLYYGKYVYSTAPFGISAKFGSLTFQTNPSNVDFGIGVLNNEDADVDYYDVSSKSNYLLDNGVMRDIVLGFRLWDYTGNAFSSDALPLMPLDLSQWQDNIFGVEGEGVHHPPGSPSDMPFSINGHVTSVWIIPEPATLLLLGMGGLWLRKRS